MSEYIGALEDGTVWTRWSKGKNQYQPPVLLDYWRINDTYCGAKFRPKQSITVPAPIAKELVTRPRNNRVLAGRFNLECYVNRLLEGWEVCRHGRGGNSDHSMANLSAGCQLNNIIDEVESGKIVVPQYSLEIAIKRLQHLSTTV